MIDETIVKQAATRHQQSGNLIALYRWFFTRIFVALMSGLFVIYLLYLTFFLPDGLAGINYAMITTRWLDPRWGVLWRVFDWLLVVLGVVIGAQMLQPVTEMFRRSPAAGRWVKAILNVFYVGIILLAAQIIFGFGV